MWNVDGLYLSMVDGDYGIALPFTFDGITPAASDSMLLTIKAVDGTTALIEKTFENPVSGISLELTEAESALLPVGVYNYSLDWYRNGVFMCNIIPTAFLKVVDKL